MDIGIIDAELLEKSNHRFPNLACMKLSSFHKAKGDNVRLCLSYSNTDSYDIVYVSKVFTGTKVPENVLKGTNIKIGGTGFFYDKYDNAPMLSKEIEHSKPDYELYEPWVKTQKEAKIAALKYYTDYSIGFTTRGCFRKCPFCVNRHSSEALLASPIDEFFDPKRKKICLLDDNVFAYKNWKQVFDELNKKTEEYRTTFEYKQGLDIRLLTDEKAKYLAKAKYSGEFIFAFDNIKDKDIITKNCALLRKYSKHSAKFYVFCAYNSQDDKDIATVFERIKMLWKFEYLAYIMRHERYETAKEPYRSMYVQLGRWCNQPQFQKKMSFRIFCTESGGKAKKEMQHLEKLHPDFKDYLDMRYNIKEQDTMERLNKAEQLNMLLEEDRMDLLKVSQILINREGRTKQISALQKELELPSRTKPLKTEITPKPLEKSVLANTFTEESPIVPVEPIDENKKQTEIASAEQPTFDSLNLRKPIIECFKKANLYNLEILCSKTKEEIINIKGFREKWVGELKTSLKKIGRDFAIPLEIKTAE